MKTNDQHINTFKCSHLSKEQQVKTGSFYTPKNIVQALHSLIAPYKKKRWAVILDNSAGAGAFMKQSDNIRYKAVEIDPKAGAFLSIKYPNVTLYMDNALKNPHREKYNISYKDFLIQIGNPPYNDTTSAYRNGKKGESIADPDLLDRDIGISFLKSYNKLKSDIVCVLHPLSYLIKLANFRRLGNFKQNYRLKKGILFSSQVFNNVSKTAFPIMIGLYVRNPQGMSYDYIKNFKFSFLTDQKKNTFSFFKLNQYSTVDTFIRKYPPPKTGLQKSNINLYYWTFRDINSLFRNKGFHIQKGPHSVVVTLENFYQYAYLLAFKKLFRPQSLWIYGNLSPLGNEEMVRQNKKLWTSYAILSERKKFSQMACSIKNKIMKFYSVSEKINLSHIENKITNIFKYETHPVDCV